MTQIGEPLAVAEVDVDELECPFDHRDKPLEVENDLIGVGSTLARKMANTTGTHLYAGKCPELDQKFSKEYPDKERDKILNPKHRQGPPRHPFYDKAKVVKIETYSYPVTCAAHHCIPAQESLKVSPLLVFMCKKGDVENLKEGDKKIDYTDGMVWSDVGYDVNGSQNGIFLPGSYAVGGGRGGTKKWERTDDGDEDEPEEAEDVFVDPASDMLSGPLAVVSLNNRKWLYVAKAVHLCPGQFHDRHEDYSEFVQSVLKKIFVNYNQLRRKYIVNKNCGECKKRAETFEKRGIPTPYGLVTRLNKVSDKFKNCLNGTTWRQGIYTSKWGRAYMKAVEDRKPDANIKVP